MFNKKETLGFCCDSLPGGGGFTLTLTTQLGLLLHEAEERFGLRDKNWTPIGIEFSSDGPKIWFPGKCDNVSIMLSEANHRLPILAQFELAHEVIHLLSPRYGQNAPVIEEGLAEYFKHEIMKRNGFPIREEPDNYARAESLVAQLLELQPDSIKTIRERECAFYRFTPDLICSIVPQVERELANSLCEPFPYI